MSVPGTDNLRRSPRHQARHEVCLTAPISLLDVQAEAVRGQEKPLTLFGSTRDLSEAGVALVVPFLPIDESYCWEESDSLQITLYLPTGVVSMQVAPVRCRPLDDKEPGKGFFMGAQITEIDEVERASLTEYLNAIPD